MKTFEEIAIEHGLCTCSDAYTSRNLQAPDCPLHAFALPEAVEAYTDQFKPKWIPVDEMLPDKEGGYNVVVIDGAREFVMSLRFSIDNDSWFFIDPAGTAKITHWQPLPSAPERKELFKP